MNLNERTLAVAGLVLGMIVSIAMHWSIFSLDIQGTHNWRQSQTMWNVRNFVRYEDNILNTRIAAMNNEHTGNLLRYEFPVMQYGIAQVQKVFGEDILVARICMWLITAFGLIGFYLLLRTMAFSPLVASVGTLCLQFSPLLYFYGVNVLPDVFALAAGIWYLYFAFSYFRDRRPLQLLGTVGFLLLATLAKLPFVVLGVASFLYVPLRLFGRGGGARVLGEVAKFSAAHVLAILPAIAWYWWVMPGWEGNPILTGIFGSTNDAAANLKILDYYLKVMFPLGLLSPAYWFFVVVGIFWPGERPAAQVSYAPYVWAVAIMCFVYLALQWNTINTVHDYYLLPFMPWLYIVVSGGVARLWQMFQFQPGMRVLAVIFPFTLYLAADFAYEEKQVLWEASRSYRYEWFSDVLEHREALRNAVDDDALAIIINDNTLHIFPWLIRKRGFVFSGNSLQPEWIDDLARRRGARYLYSNSRKVDERPDIRDKLGPLILEAGRVRVYPIKAAQDG